MAGRYGDDDNRDRWRDEDREGSNWRSGGQGTSERDDERGFFERAGEEIRSWFSDDDERGNQRGHSSWDREREMNRGSSRGSEQYRSGGGWSGGSSWDRDQDRGQGGSFSDRDRERSYGRIGRGGTDYENRSGFGGMAQGGYGRSGGSGREEGQSGYGPSRGGGEWRSMSGRDRSSFGGSGEDRNRGQSGNRGHAQSWGEANRGQSNWDRDRDQGSLGYSSGMSGTLGGFGNQTSFGSGQDDHYRSWRDRQLAELDRDYDDYCREREQQFHSDFNTWRRSRSSRSPSATTNASGADLSAASNAGVGTTTGSVTGSAGAGSASGSATGTGGSIQADTTGSTETAGEGTGSGAGRSGSRTRS
jgi:hypothetical protein